MESTPHIDTTPMVQQALLLVEANNKLIAHLAPLAEEALELGDENKVTTHALIKITIELNTKALSQLAEQYCIMADGLNAVAQNMTTPNQ